MLTDCIVAIINLPWSMQTMTQALRSLRLWKSFNAHQQVFDEEVNSVGFPTPRVNFQRTRVGTSVWFCTWCRFLKALHRWVLNASWKDVLQNPLVGMCRPSVGTSWDRIVTSDQRVWELRAKMKSTFGWRKSWNAWTRSSICNTMHFYTWSFVLNTFFNTYMHVLLTHNVHANRAGGRRPCVFATYSMYESPKYQTLPCGEFCDVRVWSMCIDSTSQKHSWLASALIVLPMQQMCIISQPANEPTSLCYVVNVT